MKAIVLEKAGKLEYREIAKPNPEEDEVLVKVMAAGICGSDIPRAYRDGAHKMPIVIGHEFAGRVESAGDRVSPDLIGKRVGIFPLIPCRKCGPCLEHKYEMCRDYSYLGSRRDGGFAEYVTVPSWNLIELPDSVTFEAAAMLEPMAVAVHAMRRTVSFVQNEPAGSDRTVVVCGLGTIGTLLVMFLLDAGFTNLLVVGNKEFQRNTMRKLGIPDSDYCDSGMTSPYDFVMDHTGHKGAGIFFECVGSNETVSLAIDCTAPAGSVCLVGNPHSDMTFAKNVYWKILRNQIRVTGTWNSSFFGNGEDGDDWHYVLKRLENRKICPEDLITQRYSLEDICRGFELMRDKSEDYIKVMYSRN